MFLYMNGNSDITGAVKKIMVLFSSYFDVLIYTHVTWELIKIVSQEKKKTVFILYGCVF